MNGRVDFDDMKGPVDTVVVNGAMNVRLNQVVQPVRLEVTNGRIAFALPATSKADLSARVVNGGFSIVGLHPATQSAVASRASKPR